MKAKWRATRSKKPTVTFHVVTLFPEALTSYLSSSIIGRAVAEKLVAVRFYNPKDYARPASEAQKKRARPFLDVDGRPFGGGPGMVVRAEPVLDAVGAAKKFIGRAKHLTYFFDAGGEQFTNGAAAKVAATYPHVILICGRYEGIDARVADALKATKLSIGPFILTGGELPALIVMDATARQVPGTLGDGESIEESRVASHESYTRPAVLSYKGKKYPVPAVLLSGDHKKIEEWKRGVDRK